MRFLALFLVASSAIAAPWSHIEYGAANVQSGQKVIRPGDKLELSVLERTLDDLVARNGPIGTFYVNDLDPEMTARAGNVLTAYATKKGWKDLQIRVLPGNFYEIELPYTDTAHLKNPPAEVLDSSGQTMVSLQRLANHSRDGLEVVTSQRQFENFPSAYSHVKALGQATQYKDPLGREVSKPHKRYRIERLTPFVDNSRQSKGTLCPVLIENLYKSLRP